MILMITTQENRKYPAWMVRVRIGDQWWQVHNIAAPSFWRDWWDGWRGRRAWALRWHLRRLVRRIPENIYLPTA
jgi:hypothetical protein